MPKKVLIVEDEIYIMNIISFGLKRKGYQVITAAEGNEALALASKHDPSVILLDYMLPGMNGLQICAELKKESKTAAIPIIMITALDDKDLEDRTKEAGITILMRKPFSPNDLQEKIEELLGDGKTHE